MLAVVLPIPTARFVGGAAAQNKWISGVLKLLPYRDAADLGSEMLIGDTEILSLCGFATIRFAIWHP